jgi:ferredoxin
MKHPIAEDSFLVERLKRYDGWLKDGLISFSSRIIPVAESIAAAKWVLPTCQAGKILRDAESIAVQPCECRTHYGRCDNPREVCLLFNQAGDRLVSKGLARRVSFAEATDILKAANLSGLIHLCLYMPDHEVYALCSCCTCCCHDLQLVQSFGRTDLMVHSDYIVSTDDDQCVHCGECIGRCPFGARNMVEDRLKVDLASCVGCGLCVTACPSGAVSMELRQSSQKVESDL